MHPADSESQKASLQARIAALKASKLAALAEVEPTEEEALQLELVKAERELREAQALRDARKTLGNKFAQITTPLGLVIVKRSGTAAYRKLQDSEKLEMDDFEQFVRPCVFYPPQDELDKLLNELPGAIPGLVAAVSALMGASQAEKAKK